MSKLEVFKIQIMQKLRFRETNVIYIYIYIYDISSLRVDDLTLILLTWRKW